MYNTQSNGFWSGLVIGLNFFENEAGATVTMNGLRYREMINYFLCTKLDSIELDNLYLQQDGATPNTSNETIDLLREKFPECVISRRGDHNWPLSSCDLKLATSSFGATRKRIYADSPASIQDLKE